MLEIVRTSPTEVTLKGRMDATQSAGAFEQFDKLEGSCTVHFDQLEYISSAGLSVLLHTQQRLSGTGGEIKLRGMNPHVRMVFDIAGFDSIFDIA